MIPERIYLNGFLCYREPQEARFDGCCLWMLSGPNGSGKSALFDAVTFALYGYHRGGRHNVRGLINKACERLAVEFDFRLDDCRYRAHRTLDRHGRSTRQLYRECATACQSDQLATWQPIADTHSETGFGRWVQQNVALTYETFTASVLLLQGKADNLLQVGPARRHELLSQVVGMECYEQLHERARQQSASARGAAINAHRQIRDCKKVSRRQLTTARQTVKEAAAKYERSSTEAEQLGAAVPAAWQWKQVELQRAALRQQLEELEGLLGHAERIEADYRRWQLLGAHLDDLVALTQHRDKLAGCEQALARLHAQQQHLRQSLATLEATGTGTLAALRDCEERIEATVSLGNRLGAEHSDCRVAGAALRRLHRSRLDLDESCGRQRQAQTKLDEAAMRRQELTTRMPSAADVEESRRRGRQAQELAARAAATLEELDRQCRRLEQVADSRTCSFCQQPLPSAHVDAQRSRLRQQRAEADARCGEARETLDAAETATRQLEQRRTSAENELCEIDVHIGQLKARTEQTVHNQRELRRLGEEVLGELPHTYRRRVEGTPPQPWYAAAYPTADDLESVDREIERLKAEMQRAAEHLERQQDQRKRLRREQAEQEEQKAKLLDRLARVSQEMAELQGHRTHHEQACGSTRAALPSDWQAWPSPVAETNVASLKDEWRSLEASGIEGRYAKLQRARAERDTLMAQLKMLDQQAEAIPQEARQAPELLRTSLTELRDACRHLQEAHRSAIAEQVRLEQAVEARQSLLDEARRADRQQHLWERLSNLLGRDYLQRAILASAETTIVQYANTILDRLAGGHVYLELRQQQPEQRSARRALDLLARTTTAESQLQDVAFLSGSQKFRLAVALSLAIGQFASRTRSPVQAVIIDEGFGCLDTVNRHVMIQELQNLRSQLQRIVLVSHQDEFAGAFPDGYQCELVNGTTRLTPFHR